MTLKTTIEINGEEIPVEVEFSYDPGEREVRYYTGRNGLPTGEGHPGCPESAEIESVKDTDTGEEIDVYEIFTREQIEELENKCIAAATEKETP
jgi:hypothetical protein